MDGVVYKAEKETTSIHTRLAIVGICISLFMVNLDGSIVGIGLPSMIRQLDTTFAMGQWFVLIYMLVLTALVSAAGSLGDIFGKKKLYITGIIIFTMASLLCGFAGNGWSLLVARGIQGIGASFILSLSVAIAAELAPSHQLGRIMGLLSTVMALGIACGPTIGGMLLSIFGWQSMFMVNVPFGIIACWLAYMCIATQQVVKYTRVDWIGMLLLVLILSSYCLSMTLTGHAGITDLVISLSLLAVAIGGVFVFVWFEQKVTAPLVDIEILKSGLVSRNLLVTVLVATMIVTTIILPPFYLSGAAHMSSLETGLLMSFGPLLTVVLSIPAGRVADKYGAGNVIFVSVLLMAVGCMAMSTVTPQQGTFGYLWRIGLIQLGFSFFKTPNNTIIMKAAQPGQRGLLSGFLSLSRILGQITGTAIMGLLFALFSGISTAGVSTSLAGAAAITHSFDRIFLINGMITIIAALLIFPKSKQDK